MNKTFYKISGWLVFAIAFIVYYYSAERTGSLWDCGEFILGAYKLEVVHPPGAPIFLLIGRMFTWVATLVSDNPENIAFAVNLMSGISTAFAAAFIAWTTGMLGKLTLEGRDGELTQGENIALGFAALVAGLSTAFATSIWFSAVEGEVYAMSTFFTTLTLWSTVKWYALPDNIQTDRWLLFTVYAAGLSIGVHLLSLLTFPALALFYYFKKYKNHSAGGVLAAAGVGVAMIVLIQKVIIVGIPTLWKNMEMLTVNGMGMSFNSGLVPTLVIVIGVLVGGLYFASVKKNQLLQYLFVGLSLLVISFSTIGTVVIRANADTPVNMNKPSDPMRLLPYLNREQYGERALLRGPQFNASPTGTDIEDRWGRVGDKYEKTDYKISLEYKNSDKKLFPRMADNTQGRPSLYKQWMGLDPSAKLPPNRPNFVDNIKFFFNYQINWMYWRYFMWNFSGRQNGEQGYYSWDKSAGNWITGVKFIDEMRLGNLDELPERMKNDKARNTYFALPFIFGLIGMFFHFKRRPEDALAVLALFVITGIGIVVYSNQPPNEPRERDYVLAGSIFTYTIWIGMAVLALFRRIQPRMSAGVPAAVIAGALVLIAPVLMGTQNFDDHTRKEHKASRDYASNFLNSCEPNAIVFTYGDNDTYPLWYAQEVEGIRTDVRVVNLSLIAVDWYIDLLRRRVGESAPLKMTIPKEAYRGKKRNQLLYYNPEGTDRMLDIRRVLQFIGEEHPLPTVSGRQLESFYPTKKTYLPIDSSAVIANGIVSPEDADNIVKFIPIQLKDQMIKDELAILDVIASNFMDRPIYFAVTAQIGKFQGLEDYTQLEGLALRIVPIKSKSENNIFGVVGSGRVNADKAYENIMEKFHWGNFDKVDTYISMSYMPSIQTTQLAMRRTAYALLRQGEKEKAIALIDKFFEVFPENNFHYNYQTWYMIAVYLQAGAYDKAKPIIQKLALQTKDDLDFYFSLSDKIRESSYRTDTFVAMDVMQSLMDEAQKQKDTELQNYLNELFAEYLSVDPQAPSIPAGE